MLTFYNESPHVVPICLLVMLTQTGTTMSGTWKFWDVIYMDIH